MFLRNVFWASRSSTFPCYLSYIVIPLPHCGKNKNLQNEYAYRKDFGTLPILQVFTLFFPIRDIYY